MDQSMVQNVNVFHYYIIGVARLPHPSRSTTFHLSPPQPLLIKNPLAINLYIPYGVRQLGWSELAEFSL